MRPEKPFAPACDKNREPILRVLQACFASTGRVLEIGSGTGQHAVYFGHQLPHLTWQPTDLPEHLPGIDRWVDDARLENVAKAIPLDVNRADWQQPVADYVFTANTLHIMHWASVCAFFAGAGRILRPGGTLCVYGPFNFDNHYTSQSNAEFDRWLKARDPQSGIRNFEDLAKLAEDHGLEFLNDHPLPANNRILEWIRAADS